MSRGKVGLGGKKSVYKEFSDNARLQIRCFKAQVAGQILHSIRELLLKLSE